MRYCNNSQKIIENPFNMVKNKYNFYNIVNKVNKYIFNRQQAPQA